MDTRMVNDDFSPPPSNPFSNEYGKDSVFKEFDAPYEPYISETILETHDFYDFSDIDIFGFSSPDLLKEIQNTTPPLETVSADPFSSSSAGENDHRNSHTNAMNPFLWDQSFVREDIFQLYDEASLGSPNANSNCFPSSPTPVKGGFHPSSHSVHSPSTAYTLPSPPGTVSPLHAASTHISYPTKASTNFLPRPSSIPHTRNTRGKAKEKSPLHVSPPLFKPTWRSFKNYFTLKKPGIFLLLIWCISLLLLGIIGVTLFPKEDTMSTITFSLVPANPPEVLKNPSNSTAISPLT